MPSLLTLPLELRLIILHYNTIDSVTKVLRKRDTDRRQSYFSIKSPYLDLLLSCKQLRDDAEFFQLPKFVLQVDITNDLAGLHTERPDPINKWASKLMVGPNSEREELVQIVHDRDDINSHGPSFLESDETVLLCTKGAAWSVWTSGGGSESLSIYMYFDEGRYSEVYRWETGGVSF